MGSSFLLTLLLGCASEPSRALVLTGWSYDWALLSHRIGYLRTDLEQDSRLHLGLIGGDWSTGESASDTPSYRVRYADVSASGVAFAEGVVSMTVGPAAEGTTTLVIEDAPEGAHLSAFLQGFTLNCDTPQSADYPDYPARYGYTSNGFGFALGEPVRSGADVSVPVTATVRWGPQDREDMNAAIPYAQTAVEVHVLLVASDLPPAATSVSGSVSYPFEPPYTEQPPMTAAATLDSRGVDGFFGWRAWQLDANLTGEDAGEGDYIRAMGVEAVPTADARRTISAAVTATFSNSSALELTHFAAGFSGELVRIGAPLAEVVHYEVSGTHPVGPAEAGPTLDD